MLYVQEAGETRGTGPVAAAGRFIPRCQADSAQLVDLGEITSATYRAQRMNDPCLLTPASVTPLFLVPSGGVHIIFTISLFRYLCIYLLSPYSRKDLRKPTKQREKGVG